MLSLGSLVKVVIPRPGSNGELGPGVGKVHLRNLFFFFSQKNVGGVKLFQLLLKPLWSYNSDSVVHFRCFWNMPIQRVSLEHEQEWTEGNLVETRWSQCFILKINLLKVHMMGRNRLSILSLLVPCTLNRKVGSLYNFFSLELRTFTILGTWPVDWKIDKCFSLLFYLTCLLLIIVLYCLWLFYSTNSISKSGW